MDAELAMSDDLVVVHDVSWDEYEARLVAKGDGSAPRISYLDGELELMSPTLEHERIKSNIGAASAFGKRTRSWPRSLSSHRHLRRFQIYPSRSAWSDTA